MPYPFKRNRSDVLPTRHLHDALIPMAIVTSDVSHESAFLRFSLSLDRARTRTMPKNDALDQNNQRLSALSAFFRVLSSLAMERYAVTFQLPPEVTMLLIEA